METLAHWLALPAGPGSPPAWSLVHWRAGWALVLAGFVAGALLGLGFHRAGFLGGYASFRRRLARLGHVALVALGFLNLLVAAAPAECLTAAGSALLVTGSVLMPAVCFLSAWREPLRRAFFLPVLALAGAAVCFLLSVPGGP